MSKIKFEVVDYYDLVNLHKALLEAKFHSNPDNENISSSPVIANFCNNIIDLLGNHNQSWIYWRNIENQSFFMERAINNAILYNSMHKDLNQWENLNFKEKYNISQNYLSPFIGDENSILYFIDEVTNKSSTKNKIYFINRAIEDIVFYNNISDDDNLWISLNNEEKLNLSKNYLSPFTSDENDILYFIDKVNERLEIDC